MKHTLIFSMIDGKVIKPNCESVICNYKLFINLLIRMAATILGLLCYNKYLTFSLYFGTKRND